jgi:Transposase domain (DUF772)
MKSPSQQRTLAMMTGFERYTKKTRRAIFLEEMEQVVPWAKLCALIEPHYPKPGNGRRPKELEKMLRIYFLQQWFNLADPAVEEALYDSATLRQFVGIDLGGEPVPDETTVCNFRHLLEKHNLGCRVAVISRVRLLISKDFHESERLEFFFIAYSFSFINRVRVPNSVCETHRYILDST